MQTSPAKQTQMYHARDINADSASFDDVARTRRVLFHTGSDFSVQCPHCGRDQSVLRLVQTKRAAHSRKQSLQHGNIVTFCLSPSLWKQCFLWYLVPPFETDTCLKNVIFGSWAIGALSALRINTNVARLRKTIQPMNTIKTNTKKAQRSLGTSTAFASVNSIRRCPAPNSMLLQRLFKMLATMRWVCLQSGAGAAAAEELGAFLHFDSHRPSSASDSSNPSTSMRSLPSPLSLFLSRPVGCNPVEMAVSARQRTLQSKT
jgi:hypothetical protein